MDGDNEAELLAEAEADSDVDALALGDKLAELLAEADADSDALPLTPSANVIVLANSTHGL